MRVATCAVCGERLNLLREKLITAEWVDSASGALVAMQFHSPCFVRWYQETASARTAHTGPAAAPPEAGPAPASGPSQKDQVDQGGKGAPGGAPAPEGPGPAPSPPPEDVFSAGERERLRQLRRRREDLEAGAKPAEPPEAQGGPGAGGGPGSAGAPGQQPEGDQHGVREDDQAPQHE